MLLSGAGLGLIYVYVSNGFACDPFLGVVVSCSVNKKTTATNGGSFAGIQSYQLFLPKVTGFHGAQVPKLSFQCSRSQATTSRTLDTSLAHPVYQWLLPVALCRVFPGWTQDDIPGWCILASRRAIGHWLILLLLSVLFSSLLLRIHLPAALLLGPLIAGLILSLRGVKLSIPRPCYLAAQAIVGCMIARAINPSVFGVLFNNWALVLAILLTTLAISGLTGWLLVRYSALPGATGAWGSSPGGASAMVVMAQEYGADVRLVALMQYLRVLFVVGAAALVVRYALGNEAQEMTQDIVWFPSLTLNFPFTLLLTAVACWLGMRLRIPSGAMLLPMLLGALAQGGGWLMLELPEWLLAMAYAVLGWTVGLQFNKAIFLLALKTLPQIIASILGLILMCALMALALTHILQMDFMTAYLATSPGGLDTVAIIAAGTRADMSFIMALQTLRLFTILLTGPAMARAISRYAPRQ